jgi:hypothetical protein
VQTVTITGTPTGGTFTLIYRGKETATIAYNATNATVQSALEALSTIGTGNVTVTGGPGPGTPYVVTAAGTLAGSNMELIEGNAAALTGGTTPSVSVVMTTRGVATGHYKHKFHAITDSTQVNWGMPTGFSLEKGFAGLDSGAKGFFSWLGCRVDSLGLGMNINQMMRGTWDVVAREMLDPATATISSSVTAAGTEDPFTSSQIAVLEGSTLAALGIARSANCSISNGYRRDSGYILGSNKRANLKPSRFTAVGDMELMFKNTTLYEKATARTASRLLFGATSGSFSLDLHLLSVKFNPVNSVPKVTDDGPLTIPVTFTAHKPSANVSIEGTNYGVTVPTIAVAVLVSDIADYTV